MSDATSDLLVRLTKENVWYAEVRFCPTLHTMEGLTEDQAVQAVLEGMSRHSGERGQIVVGVIICALRSKEPQHGIEMVKLAKKYMQVKCTQIVQSYVLKCLELGRAKNLAEKIPKLKNTSFNKIKRLTKKYYTSAES